MRLRLGRCGRKEGEVGGVREEGAREGGDAFSEGPCT